MQRTVSLALVATLTLPGFAGPSAAPAARAHRPDVTAPVPTDSVWVFTNRARADDRWLAERGPLSHEVRAFRVTPVRHDEVSFEVRLDVDRVHARSLTSTAMLDALRHELDRPDAGASAMVLHVHGYATSLDEATEEAAEMRQRGGFTGPMAVFAWPARSVGVTWPAPGRLFTNAYWQDAESADASADDLAKVLVSLVETVGADRLVVSAHSMGNRLLAVTLEHPEVQRALTATPLRALVFAAPDLARDHFREGVLPIAERLARRLVLYGARDDHMLRLSAIVHDGQQRAGLLGDDVRWPAPLEVVDITHGRVAAPWLGPWFDSNHAFRRHGTALTDLFRNVVGDAPASARQALGFMTRDDRGAWLALDAPLPERPWMMDASDASSAGAGGSARP